jgi:hypothetical protein
LCPITRLCLSRNRETIWDSLSSAMFLQSLHSPITSWLLVTNGTLAVTVDTCNPAKQFLSAYLCAAELAKQQLQEEIRTFCRKNWLSPHFFTLVMGEWVLVGRSPQYSGKFFSSGRQVALCGAGDISIPSFIACSSKHERPTRPGSKAKASGWEICSTFCSRRAERSVHERKRGTLVVSFSVRRDGRRDYSRGRWCPSTMNVIVGHPATTKGEIAQHDVLALNDTPMNSSRNRVQKKLNKIVD